MPSQDYILKFQADLTGARSSLRGFAGDAKSLLTEIQRVASRPIKVSASTSGAIAGGTSAGFARAAADPDLQAQAAALRRSVIDSAAAGGASFRQQIELGDKFVTQAFTELARELGLSKAAATRFAAEANQAAARFAEEGGVVDRSPAAVRAREIAAREEAARAARTKAIEDLRTAEQTKLQRVQDQALDREYRRARAERIVQEEKMATVLRQEAILEARRQGLTRRQIRNVAARSSIESPGSGNLGAGPLGGLRQGFGSVLRFAIPSAILFGASRGIRSIVEEAEELQQINIRLEAQFENLGKIGAFDNILEALGEIPNAANRLEAANIQFALFSDTAKEISVETGVATDQVFALGSAFIGLFASFEDTTGIRGLAEEATKIASEFSVITGLAPEEAFNDLVGAVRTFADTGSDATRLLRELTDDLISVSDVSGVAANDLADFVGRIAPIADTAGFVAEEIAAIGGALLQASGVGGAQLAEQFGRIISTFGDGLDEELADLAVNVPDLGLNLDDIFAGNTRDVLFQLVNGFDDLSEAQQRNIVASLGSRREGNTLATLLQNNTAVLAALEAQQNNTGASSERFADISATLTVRFNQLKVQFEQLGQNILKSGLDDILRNIIEIIAAMSSAIEGTLVPTFKALSAVFGSLPTEAITLTVTLGALTAAFVSLSRSMRVTLAGAATGPAFASSLGAIGTRATVASAATRNLSLAVKGLGIAGVALAGTYAVVNAFQSASARRSEEARVRVEELTQSLREAGSELVSIGDRAAEFNETLSETIALREREKALEGDVGGNSPSGPLAGTGINGGVLVDLIAEKNQFDELNFIIDESGLKVTQLIEEMVLLKEEFNSADLSNLLLLVSAEGNFNSFRRSGDSDSRIELINSLNELVANNGIEKSVNFASTLIKAQEAAQTTVAEQAKSVETFLQNQRVSDLLSGELRQQVDDLLDTRQDGTVGDIQFVFAAANLFPDELTNAAAEAASAAKKEQEDLRSQIQEGVTELAVVRAQLEAGVATADEFRDAAGIEVGKLRTQLASASDVGSPEDVLRIINEINAIEKELAELAVNKFENDQRIAALLGQETGTVADLTTLALDIDVQNNQEAFLNAVENVIEEEKRIAIEAASRADSAEEALRILNSFQLSEEAGLLFIELQVRESGGQLEQLLGLEGATEERIEEVFNSISADIQAGLSLQEAVRAYILARIAELEALLGPLAGRIGGSGAADELGTLRASLAGLGGTDLPTIETGTDSVISAEEIAEVIEAQQTQYENILDDIEENSRILRAFGTDNTGDALGKKAAALIQLLQDPGFVNSEQRLEAALMLAEVLGAIDQLTAAEIAVAQQAIDAVSNGANPENLITAEAVFAAINNQTNAYNAYLRKYLDVSEDVLNILTRSIANLVAGGKNAIDSSTEAINGTIGLLRSRVSQLEITISRFGGQGDVSGLRNTLARLRDDLAKLEAERFRIGFTGGAGIPDIDTSGISIGNVSVSGGGGGGGGGRSNTKQDELEEAASDLADAEFALLKAQFSLDPVAIARIAQKEAALALEQAETAADKIRAEAAKIEADRSFADAIKDVFDAQRELASTLAELSGDVTEVLRIGVEQAEEDLAFLRESGAGEASIARAEAALARAKDSQRTGLIDEDLEDLSFLFDIGEITTQQYIAQLEAVLSTLDPLADKDLYRDLVRQINDLRGRTNDLQFNIGADLTPSFLDVQRLSQFGSREVPQLSARQIEMDARDIDIIIYADDSNKGEMIEIIGEAVRPSGSFSSGTRAVV